MFTRRYGEMDMVPAGWGVAWFDYVDGRVICLPVPLNKLAGLVRVCWLWARRPVGIKTLTDAYEQGRASGLREERWSRSRAMQQSYRQGRAHEAAIIEAQLLSGSWKH